MHRRTLSNNDVEADPRIQHGTHNLPSSTYRKVFVYHHKMRDPGSVYGEPGFQRSSKVLVPNFGREVHFDPYTLSCSELLSGGEKNR